MLKNYFIVGIRNLKRQRFYSLINILGLAIGLTVVMLIALNIKFEYSFSSFNKNVNRIYRVGTVFQREGKVVYKSPEFVAALGPAMLKDFHEIKNFVRLSTLRSMSFTYGDRSFMIENVTYADSSLFDVFSFHLIEGNVKKALKDPYSIILVKSTATKIFGRNDAIGKIITIEGQPYLVTGIVENVPSNSDIQFNAIISFSTLNGKPNSNHFLGWYGGNQFITYIELKRNSSPAQVDKKLSLFLSNQYSQFKKLNIKFDASLQPLTDIHLYYNNDSAALRRNLGTFSIIAIFILLIACANFVNLSTARASGRAKEVGMRKVLGANRRSLIIQYLTDSILYVLIAFIFALVLVELLISWYDNLIGKQLVLSSLFDGQFILLLFAILLITSVAAGSYPALFLSSYQPVSTLKGNLAKGKNKLLLRKSLVILQFSISIVLIASTLIINDQIRFMRSNDPGFNKNNILVISLDNDALKTQYGVLKNELRRIPGVIDIAASTDVPGHGFTSNGYFPQGYKSPLMIHVVDGDKDFLKTYGINLIKGRNFSKEIASDQQAYIINESLAKLLNWTEPLDKKIIRDVVHPVIGVVKDFNYAPLYFPIQPLIITDHPESGSFNYVSIQIESGNLRQVINSIQNVWHKFAPTLPLDYFFLNQQFNDIYRSEFRFREVFLIFSSLAIFVALLGLLGLVSYSVELRRKEIGIRKVLGSPVAGIVTLISKEYIRWILAANIISLPIAFFIMQKWLQNFAYKISITPWVFILAAVIEILVAAITIILQALRAATSNPVKSLRYE